MRVSQRVDYALRALVLLARCCEDEQIAAGDIAERLNLPRRFVEQQFTELARNGIVKCRRGAGGGCTLARPAATITVREVVAALEGDVLDVPHVSGSAATELWAGAAQSLAEFLEGVSIAELAERQKVIDAEHSSMYYI